MPWTLVLCLLLAGAPPARDAGVPKGQRVMAPWGRHGKRFAGKVAAQYGKFALVLFDDGYEGWCEVDLLNPPGLAAPAPRDPNPFTPGQKVTARWSKKGALPAVVVDTYGKLTLVHFESEDRAWIMVGEISPR